MFGFFFLSRFEFYTIDSVYHVCCCAYFVHNIHSKIVNCKELNFFIRSHSIRLFSIKVNGCSKYKRIRNNKFFVMCNASRICTWKHKFLLIPSFFFFFHRAVIQSIVSIGFVSFDTHTHSTHSRNRKNGISFNTRIKVFQMLNALLKKISAHKHILCWVNETFLEIHWIISNALEIHNYTCSKVGVFVVHLLLVFIDTAGAKHRKIDILLFLRKWNWMFLFYCWSNSTFELFLSILVKFFTFYYF